VAGARSIERKRPRRSLRRLLVIAGGVLAVAVVGGVAFLVFRDDAVPLINSGPNPRTPVEAFTAAFGRFERIQVGDRRLLMLLIKNPAGANEAVRTLVEGSSPRLAVIALNDAIADGRDVSWIWDVDFEPLLPGLERLIATGDRAAELALRFKYAGMGADAIEVVPSLERALDRGLELTPPGDELVLLPTYTAMLALRKIVSERGFVRPYWERAA